MAGSSSSSDRKTARVLAMSSVLVVAVGCSKDLADPVMQPAGASPDAGMAPNTPPSNACDGPRDPGRVTLHRLNRAEYNNTVRDLLRDTTQPATDFPADDHGHGFDNNADVLSTSPLLFEKYDLATTNLVQAALPKGIDPLAERFEAEVLEGSIGAPHQDWAWNLYSNGSIDAPIIAPLDGEYELSARVYGQQAGPDPARMTFSIDGRVVIGFAVMAEAANPRVYTSRTRLTAGQHSFSVAFINDYYAPDDPDPTQRDRNLIVDWIAVEGPLDAPPPMTGARTEIMICSPADSDWATCASQIVASFGQRAWRRPLTTDEISRLVALTQIVETEGDDFDTAIGLAMQAILLSPHFVFRVELDSVPTSTVSHPVNAWELASRLSYFLWSSMPDQTLFDLAADGTLLEPAVMIAQVRRMITDDKARALVDNFAGQWLFTRALDDVNPDYAIYPEYDEALRAAMAMETGEFFKAMLDADRPALDLLDADFTFVNERLATHYGISGVTGDAPTRVTLPANLNRRGVLSQASLLSVTSYPKRTSPVRRGKFVLEQILCTPPPPPPPGVEGLPEDPMATGSLRERLEAHRSDPTCAGCHSSMDPIGFGLESFDGIGSFRTQDEFGFAIDSRGELPDGRTFEGAVQLANILKADLRTPHCFAERMFIYALGRGSTRDDRCTMDGIVEDHDARGGSFRALAESIAHSPAFTHRRGEAE